MKGPFSNFHRTHWVFPVCLGRAQSIDFKQTFTPKKEKVWNSPWMENLKFTQCLLFDQILMRGSPPFLAGMGEEKKTGMKNHPPPTCMWSFYCFWYFWTLINRLRCFFVKCMLKGSEIDEMMSLDFGRDISWTHLSLYSHCWRIWALLVWPHLMTF